MSKTPNFSQLADTEWNESDSWFDADLDLVPVSNTNTNIQVQEQSFNQPATTPNNQQSVTTKVDDTLTEYNSILEHAETNKISESTLKPTTFESQQMDSNIQEQGNTYSDVFDIANALGLIHIPEGFDTTNVDEQALTQLAEETNRYRMGIIHEEYKLVAHDPYMLEMLEYAKQGAGFADIPRMQEILSSELDYSTLNLDDIDTQKQLVYQFLSDGLDEHNPKDARLLAIIPDKIENLAKELKLKNEAIQAQRYFLNIIEQQRQQEYVRVQQAQQAEMFRQQREQAEIDNWDKSFRQALANSKWSDERKKAVVLETSNIELQDGRTVPMWQYKQEIVFNNPVLFQQYLDFMSKFDLKTNSFTDQVYVQNETNKSAVAEILNRINKKGRSFGKTQEVQFNNNNNKPTKMVVDNTKDSWL